MTNNILLPALHQVVTGYFVWNFALKIPVSVLPVSVPPVSALPVSVPAPVSVPPVSVPPVSVPPVSVSPVSVLHVSFTNENSRQFTSTVFIAHELHV